MKNLILISSAFFSICANASHLESITLSNDLSKYEINLKSRTFRSQSEAYEYRGTCYSSEAYEERVCVDDPFSSAVNCHFEVMNRQVPYSCTKVGVREVAVPDGGASEANVVVNISNPEQINEPFNLDVFIGQGVESLGRKVEFKPDLSNHKDLLIKRLPSTSFNNTTDVYNETIVGNIDLEVLKKSEITQFTDQVPEVSFVKDSHFEIRYKGEINNTDKYTLHLKVTRKRRFRTRVRERGTIKLSSLESIFENGETVFKLYTKSFNKTFKKVKKGKHKLTLELLFEDKDIVYPKYPKFIRNYKIKAKVRFKP